MSSDRLAGGINIPSFYVHNFTVSVPGLTFLGTKGISSRMAGRLMLLQKVGKEGQSMEKLQIVYLPPGDLKPYEKNARPSC